MKWFKHDSYAHTDAKLKKLRHKYGIVGFGLYFYCIELIAGKLDSKNITFELEEDAETIAREWNLDQLEVQEMMQYMVRLDLFESSGGTITCLKLAKRLDDTNSKNPEIKKILDYINRMEALEELPAPKSDNLGKSPSNSEQISIAENSTDKNRSDQQDSGGKIPPCPHQEIIEMYHKLCPTLPRVRGTWGGGRAQHLRQRWRENPDLEDWESFFNIVAKSKFLTGKVKPGKDREKPFVANLAWLIKYDNFTNILEGKYTD